MTPQPGTAGTDDDPLDSIATDQLVVNGEVINNLVGLAFDSASATDGVLRFDGTGSTSGITDGSAKVIVGGTVYDVAGGEWVDFSGTSHSLDSWEKVINSQFNVTITGVSPDLVKPGNTLDVTADVSNAGTDQDTQTVTLDIDNSVGQVDSTSVTLSGGGSTTQTLSWAVPSGQTEQDYQATVSSADDSASQTVTVSAYITDFDQTFPYSPTVNSGSITFDVVNSTTYSNGPALTINQDAAGPSDDTFKYVTKDVDATGKSSLECVTEFSRDGQYDKLRIDLGGQTLYNSASGHSFTQRSFDISGISGVVTLKIGHSISVNITREPQSTIAEIELV